MRGQIKGLFLFFCMGISVTAHSQELRSCYAQLSGATKEIIGDYFNRGEILVNFRTLHEEKIDFLRKLRESQTPVLIITQQNVEAITYVKFYEGTIDTLYKNSVQGNFEVTTKAFAGTRVSVPTTEEESLQEVGLPEISYIKVPANFLSWRASEEG